ncbi:hypothetical protein [Gordonia sihwensis]|uniref:hypothetical protein n=1 Tax=Gordonia sihwensis TaxID=173559 RepID=UPI003D953128
MEAPLTTIARRYALAQQNLDTAADEVSVFVSDADSPDDQPELSIGVMDGRIVEIAIADSLIESFRDDPHAAVALGSYINLFIWRAFDAYAERVGEYIQDGIVY